MPHDHRMKPVGGPWLHSEQGSAPWPPPGPNDEIYNPPRKHSPEESHAIGNMIGGIMGDIISSAGHAKIYPGEENKGFPLQIPNPKTGERHTLWLDEI